MAKEKQPEKLEKPPEKPEKRPEKPPKDGGGDGVPGDGSPGKNPWN